MTAADIARGLLAFTTADSLTIPRRVVEQLLEGTPTSATEAPRLAVDLTVGEAARLLGRKASTVREWAASGLIPGAHRLRGREWRLPPAGLEAFMAATTSRVTPTPGATRTRRTS